MFKRKLKSLGAHNFDSFNILDDEQFANLVVWLEDQKIRHYKIEQRQELRSHVKAIFNSALKQYLNDLQCPFDARSQRPLVVDWLLSLAVRLNYGDNAERYRKCKAAAVTGSGKSIAKPSDNPIENLDLDDPAVQTGVKSIASLLKIPPHTDHQLLLRAVCILLKERFSRDAPPPQTPSAPSNVNGDSGGHSTSGPLMVSLDNMDLGFSTSDYITDEALKILRLLHIRSLRELQTKINEALVSVQKVTADPKTDQRLGKIGR